MKELKIKADKKIISILADKIGMSLDKCADCGIKEFCEKNDDISLCSSTWEVYIHRKCEEVDGIKCISESAIKEIAKSIGNTPDCNLCKIKDYCNFKHFNTCEETWEEYMLCKFLL